MKGLKALFIAVVAAILTVAGVNTASANGNRLASTSLADVSNGYKAKTVHYRKYRRGYRRYGRKHRYYGHRKYRRGHRYYSRRHYKRRHYKRRHYKRRYYGGYGYYGYPRYYGYGPRIYFGFGY